VVRRTLGESLYLLTAPVIAAAGLLLVLGGLCAAAAGLLVPSGGPVVAGAMTPARRLADLEWWRITTVRALAARTGRAVVAGQRPRARENSASDPGWWLDAAHAVAVLPVALVTSLVTGAWWWVGVTAATVGPRGGYQPGPLPPQTLYAGSAQSHIEVSLGLASPGERLAFAATLAVVLLLTLPLVTRACFAVQARLGLALLSDASALHRRITGLEQERDAARAQTVAAVTAEATALRRLERDIHDGPQQRLVRLAMELGRAQRHLDNRPEAAREALADALVQAQEALEELRALSRGIAPPVLVDRGLREALLALAARSAIPVDLDIEPSTGRLDAAAETAVYFVVAEALTNVAKHSHASRCAVGVRHDAGALRAWVTDDGAGGAALEKGHGLRGLEDRLHGAGGRLRVISPSGGPTTIFAELPCC
jgi:signal transduction histidine kinase